MDATRELQDEPVPTITISEIKKRKFFIVDRQPAYADAVVVGICGKPGAGKDTIGTVLGRCGFGSVTLKKPIEDAVRAIFLVNDYQLYDRKAREEPLPEWDGWTVRKALQGIGLSVRELVGPQVWAKNLCLRLDAELANWHGWQARFHVADVRTPEDLVVIKKHVEDGGGRFFMLMVKRPGFGSTTTGGFANHVLESYDLEASCDVVFDNDGTIDDLHAKVATWLGSKDIHDVNCESDKAIFDAINAAITKSSDPDSTSASLKSLHEIQSRRNFSLFGPRSGVSDTEHAIHTEEDLKIFTEILRPKSSDLDPLPQAERSKFCWCKPGECHCGTCGCGKPGHVRSLGPATFCWCDACYKKAVEDLAYTYRDGSRTETKV